MKHGIALAALLVACPGPSDETGDSAAEPALSAYTVLAWPARGMGTTDASYADFALGAPAVTLRAQVLEQGMLPLLVTGGAELSYAPQDPAAVTGVTDFWEQAPALLEDAAPAEGLGLAGLGLEGVLAPGALWEAPMVPVVPSLGTGESGPFPLFSLALSVEGGSAEGMVVAPTSSDLGCPRCHGEHWTTTILEAHDARHESFLANRTPVRCGSCHAQPAYGWEGNDDAAGLAYSMHSAHAERVVELEGELEPACLACHPGPDTPFYRGNHSDRGISCADCHGDMDALADPGRQAWVDLPRCDDCHGTPDKEYQQPGQGYHDATGHGGLRCPACHHVQHGLYGSTLAQDNAQNLELQGYAGVVSTCKVCHGSTPQGLFPHRAP
jgi:hypothetical protein